MERIPPSLTTISGIGSVFANFLFMLAFCPLRGAMVKNLDHRDFLNPAFDQFATELGRVTLAWSDLHVALGGLFATILKIPNRMTPATIWDAIRVDRTQRDILASLSQTNAIGHRLPDRAKRDIKHLMSELSTLQEYRNNLIHSPYVRAGRKVVVLHGGTHARAMSLDGRDLMKECASVYASITVFRDYVAELEEAIAGSQTTWPQRPLALKKQRSSG